MSQKWRDRFQRFWERAAASKTKHRSPSESSVETQPIAINLGIDFGTSFTKVCFRDVGAEQSGLVTFNAKAADQAMVHSIVMIEKGGGLSLGHSSAIGKNVTAVRYLKMRLGNLGLERFPAIGGIDLNEKLVIAALSAWFLATVIAQAKDWMLQHEVERVAGRRIQWSANVGVPVEHYDSPEIEVFQRVLAISWTWAEHNTIPQTLEDVVVAYKRSAEAIDCETSDCHAVPEIAAAVQSFVTSRQAQPTIHVYFNVGGGTPDGVAFNYVNWDGDRRINFYSGRVAPLGIAALANRLDAKDSQQIERSFLEGTFASTLQKALATCAEDILQLVANVIMTAKKKDGRDWRRDVFEDFWRPRLKLIGLDLSRIVPLPVFVGGGGASSEWYKQTILSTYEACGHGSADIPPYRLVEVAKPLDLEMGGLNAMDFRRFAVAYGLSVPYGEGPEIRLPSHFVNAEAPPIWRPNAVMDYQDTKDAYD